MSRTHLRFGGRNKTAERSRPLEVSRVAEEDRRSMDIEDAFTERLDACEHQHMYMCDGAKAVTNHYPDDEHKASRTYIVRRIKLSFGSEGGTGHVFTCQCRDFKFRRLPKATEDAPEGETPPDPLDVPPCELSGVLWAMDDCKHTYAARRDPKPWR